MEQDDLTQNGANPQEITELSLNNGEPSGNDPSKQTNQPQGQGKLEPAKQENHSNNKDNIDIVPETYDFKDVVLPDGMELDAELTGEFSSIAKEMNLSQAKADKFIGMGVKLSQKMQQNFENAIKEAAYYLWENAGRPMGQDEYFWSLAVAQFSNNCKSSSCKSATSGSAKKSTASAKKTSSKSSSCKSASSTKKSAK